MENYEEILIENNGTLLISEIKDKVFLPYTKEEVNEILKSEENDYKTENEVVENVFTKPFKYYRNQYSARFREAIELITKREKMSLKDGIDLATEMFGKRFLHPAIITACRNLDELNVYLDCLEKNELEDFKIFNIQFEMHPMVIKNDNYLYEKVSILQKIIDFIKKCFYRKKDLDEKNVKINN